MKITILLRYPKIESSRWKLDLISALLQKGYDVSIVFGESSYWSHFIAALKEYGFLFLRRKKEISSAPKNKNLYKYFKGKTPVFAVGKLNDRSAESILKKAAPDYLLLLGTGIIRANILSIPSKGAVHCHHGHLPDFRGVSTAEWSIYHNRDVYISTHFVDTGIDTGRKILDHKIELMSNDSIADVRLRCRTESVDLILRTFDLLETGTFVASTQTQGKGRQFFFMHPFFKKIVQRKLTEASK